MFERNDGPFIPLHFCSQERKVHRENFCSIEHLLLGTFAPVDLSFQGSERSKNFRSSRANITRTFGLNVFAPNIKKTI